MLTTVSVAERPGTFSFWVRAFENHWARETQFRGRSRHTRVRQLQPTDMARAPLPQGIVSGPETHLLPQDLRSETHIPVTSTQGHTGRRGQNCESQGGQHHTPRTPRWDASPSEYFSKGTAYHTDSQMISPCWGHLSMSGGSFGCHNWGAPGMGWVEAIDTAQDPAVPRTAPPQRVTQPQCPLCED